MTIPNLQIPDTRPGYSHMDPGMGGAIGQSLQSIIAMLIQKRKMDQDQQQLDQTGQYQQGILADRAAQQQFDQQRFLQALLGQADAGQALQSIGQPGQVGMTVPGGIAPAPIQLPIGSATTPEQALSKVRPENVTTFMQQGGAKAIETGRAERTAKAKADATAKSQEDFIKALPPELQAIGRLQVLGEQGGLSPEIANALGDQVINQVDPKAVAKIIQKHPEWAMLPGKEIINLFMAEEKERMQAKFRPPDKGPTPTKLLNAPPAIKLAYNENIQAVAEIDRILVDLGLDPNDESKDALRATVMPNKATQDSITSRRGAIGRQNAFGGRSKADAALGNTVRTKMTDRVQRIRFIPLRRATGATMTLTERKEAGFLVEPKSFTDWKVNVERLRGMKRFALEQNTLMDGSYSPDVYNPIQSGKPATTRRQEDAQITGTFKP